jgi:hypothetical protein
MKKILLLCLCLCCYLQSYGAAQDPISVVDFRPGRLLVPLQADYLIGGCSDASPTNFVPRHFAQQAQEAEKRGALGLHTYLTTAMGDDNAKVANNLAPGEYDIYLFVSRVAVSIKSTNGITGTKMNTEVKDSLEQTFLMNDTAQVLRFNKSVHVKHFPVFGRESFEIKFPTLSGGGYYYVGDYYVGEALFERTGDLPVGAVAAKLATLEKKIADILTFVRRYPI